jgi:hypothetical protein
LQGMGRYIVTTHPSRKQAFTENEFEEAVYHSQLSYSLRHLQLTGTIPEEVIMLALQKSLQVCYLAGINSKYHFKQIYVFDAGTEALYVDWLMSKKGFNLMLMQVPSLNERTARWLWQLADL